MSDIDGLIDRLKAWRQLDFHADYELSDAILLADGWMVEADAAWEGGVKWSWGTNPRTNVSELQRPRLLLEIGAAIGTVPFGYVLQLTTLNLDRSNALVWHPRDPGKRWEGEGPTACVAVLIAALGVIRDTRS